MRFGFALTHDESELSLDKKYKTLTAKTKQTTLRTKLEQLGTREKAEFVFFTRFFSLPT